MVPLQIIKEDPFNGYASHNIVVDGPDSRSSNGVYRRELKSFLENAHRFRAKDGENLAGGGGGEYIEPENHLHANTHPARLESK